MVEVEEVNLEGAELISLWVKRLELGYSHQCRIDKDLGYSKNILKIY